MRINQNVMAFNATRNLSATNVALGSTLEKLSSGLRINRAADDAAGLVISQGLRAQVSGMRQATRNAQDGISVAQTAEGALGEVHSMLIRMRELAVQAANTGANDLAARQASHGEFRELRDEIDRLAVTTRFGSIPLLDGGFGPTIGPPTPVDAALVGFAVSAADGAFDGLLDQRAPTAPGSTIEITIDGAPPVVVPVGGIGGTTAQIAAGFEAAINGALAGAGHPSAGNVSVSGEFTAGAVPAESTARFTIAVAGLDDGESFTIDDGPGGGTNVFRFYGFALDTAAPPSDWNAYTVGWVDGQLGVALPADTIPGELEASRSFQVGANAGDVVDVAIASMRLTGGATGPMAELWLLDLVADPAAALGALDDAIGYVSEQRGDLGALQNRFESMISNLSVTVENLAASESRIRDADIAAEMVAFTRHQVLQQAGTAMVAQANQVPQSIMSLLR